MGNSEPIDDGIIILYAGDYEKYSNFKIFLKITLIISSVHGPIRWGDHMKNIGKMEISILVVIGALIAISGIV
ncbi:MAG: hypothetical protein WC375_12245 [Methanomassiliicoccales archaeon]